MEKLSPGYYWIEFQGEVVPAHWDGNMWYHKHGHQAHANVKSEAIAFSCPPGCTCTTNSDGSITVKCGNQ